jgi:hypothetical protein
MMRPLLGCRTLSAGCNGPHGADASNVARGNLEVAPREIDANCVAEDAVERPLELDVAPAGLERHHELDLVMHVLGERRVGHRPAIRHDGIGGLCEEERRLAHILPHLANMLLIVAADAPDPPHGESSFGTGHRDCGSRRGRDDVGLVAHGIPCWRTNAINISFDL